MRARQERRDFLARDREPRGTEETTDEQERAQKKHEVSSFDQRQLGLAGRVLQVLYRIPFPVVHEHVIIGPESHEGRDCHEEEPIWTQALTDLP